MKDVLSEDKESYQIPQKLIQIDGNSNMKIIILSFFLAEVSEEVFFLFLSVENQVFILNFYLTLIFSCSNMAQAFPLCNRKRLYGVLIQPYGQRE